jgi:3',5'-cyclic-AMP phosphodiesterase
MLIAQISDPHVCAPGVLYKGVANSNALLSEAIKHLHQLDRRPDLVLITGDLTDEGRTVEYEHALELLAQLQIRYCVIPGNHDHRERFRSAFVAHRYLPKTGRLHYCLEDMPVRIVALDSSVPNEHHGAIDESGLHWLSETLQADRIKPTLVIMHHPPFQSGIGYLDEYSLRAPDALREIIQAAPNIEAVLVGHVHRHMTHRWAGTLVIACPSTATEIALQLRVDAKPQSFLAPQACLLHLWQPGMGLVSHLSFIGKSPGPYPFF